MPPAAVGRPVSVSLLAVAQTTPATLYALFEVLGAAGVTWTHLTGERAAGRRMDVRIVGRGGRAFRSPVGPRIQPHVSLEASGTADIVIVTDLAVDVDVDPRGRWPREARWLRSQFEGGATVCSVCTGALLLAEAGLLAGEEATTHWSAAQAFRRWYPEVRLRPERILALAGPEQRIVTSGGAASWEELALYLIARYCGTTEAVRVAKIFVLGDRSEGQLPFAAMPRPRRHDDAVVARCQAWLAEHVADPRPVAAMVEHSGLAARTFKRRFKVATGYAPVEYVQAIRIEHAKRLLETTHETTEAVAHRVGYEDPAFFRALFRRRTGLTPAGYRRRYQGIAQAEASGDAPSRRALAVSSRARP